MAELVYQKATISQADGIHALVNRFANENLMLPRPLIEICETIRDFRICLAGGNLAGCCAMHVSWKNLGEIRSLAVHESYRRRGISTSLVKQCHDDARQIGLASLFVLTNTPELFTGLGYVPIAKEELPHKIWADCARCPKFPNCDEEALLYDLSCQE